MMDISSGDYKVMLEANTETGQSVATSVALHPFATETGDPSKKIVDAIKLAFEKPMNELAERVKALTDANEVVAELKRMWLYTS